MRLEVQTTGGVMQENVRCVWLHAGVWQERSWRLSSWSATPRSKGSEHGNTVYNCNSHTNWKSVDKKALSWFVKSKL